MNRLGLSLIALLAIALTGCTADRGALAQQPAATPAGALAQGVTVEGLGRVTGTPDVLRATLGVSVTRDTVQEALDTANAAAEAVVAALRDAGVAEDDIQTRQFSVNPQYDYPPTGDPVLRGYIVDNLVEAQLRDVDAIGQTLSAAVDAGGDDARVQQIAFHLEDNDALLGQARDQAFADARAKAEQYAGLAGRDLGALQSVSETLSAQPQPQPFDTVDGDAARAAAPVPIAPGSQEVSVSVTAVWSLD